MYKSRPILWLIATGTVIALCLLQGFIGCVTYEAPPFSVYCDSSDNLLRRNLGNVEAVEFDYKLYDTMDSVDIIVKESSNTTINGYKKYSNYVYTPIVLIARRACLEENSGFTVYNSGGASSTCYKDLLPILVAIEEGKQYSDIGIAKDVASGEVKLCIPSESNLYYNAVVDTIYATLNGGVPTEAERQHLKERVDNILSKCEKVEDIGTTIYNVYKKDDKNYTLFLAPENTLGISIYPINTSNNGSWNIVYLNKTCGYYFDVFIRDCENHDALFNSITSKAFANSTRCRVYNTNQLKACYSHIAESITMF